MERVRSGKNEIFVKETKKKGGHRALLRTVCHSCTHTTGDYAILLKSGIHWCTALFFNFCCSLTSVFGFFIGVAISSYSDEANGWILAIAAGLFIYIALVDLVR